MTINILCPYALQAKKFLKPELLKLLDNIYVFEKRVSNNRIARLKLRDMARSITERKVVVYPSEEALNVLSLELPVSILYHLCSCLF